MSGFKRIEFLDHFSPPFVFKETLHSFCNNPKKPLIHHSFSSNRPFAGESELEFAFDLLSANSILDLPRPLSLHHACLFPPSVPPSPLDFFETTMDLVQIQKTPLSTSLCRIQERTAPSSFSSLRKTEFEKTVLLRSLCDRVSALDIGSEQIFKLPKNISFSYCENQDLEGGVDRKYTWTAAVKGGKSKGPPLEHTYTFKAKTMPVEKKNAKGKSNTRVVEIEGPEDQRAIAALRQKDLLRKRAAAAKVDKGKKKELSPQEAALIIQMSFRVYLVHRSQTLRGLRDLAVVKAKLKELKAYFTNFSYRHRIAANPEEHQRFFEKIIVLLLTVNAIEGTDHMVRVARRDMVEDLEAMIELVDPQPPEKLGPMKRRKFNLLRNWPVPKEMALDVAEVIEMLNQEESSAFHGFSL